MLLYWIIFIISVIAWLFPPIRQYKGKYFYFFMILALLDPLAMFSVRLLKLYPYYIHCLGGLTCAAALLEKDIIKKYKWLIITGYITIIALIITRPFNFMFVIAIESLLISYILLIKIVKYYGQFNKYNVFQVVLLSYEVTILTKFLAQILVKHTGVYYFFITSAVEVFFAIYFSLVKGYEHETAGAVQMTEKTEPA